MAQTNMQQQEELWLELDLDSDSSQKLSNAWAKHHLFHKALSLKKSIILWWVIK